MIKALRDILDWSEVWALLVPLLFLTVTHKQPAILKPVIVYLWLALILNVSGDIIANFKKAYHFPPWLQSNNPVYNIHSIIRFACFSYFFLRLRHPFFKKIKKIISLASLVFVIINFTLFEDFFYPGNLSGNLLSAEAYLLLIYCMLYYLSLLRAEVELISDSPEFWVVTGLSIYVVVNFFVFLFYVPMIRQSSILADDMWSVHNIAYIVLCLFITKAFYATSARYQH